MGYFSNGSEGMDYQATYCDRCVHDEKGECPVWAAHLDHSYDECNNPESILHMLIPRSKDGWENEQCRMFIAAPAVADPALLDAAKDAHQTSPCITATKSTGGGESRPAGHIKGTGTRPVGMGTTGKARHRSLPRATGDRNHQEDSQKIVVAVSSFGPADIPQVGVTPNPVDTHKPIGRPRIHPDRKAYKAQHERDRRAKLKAQREL